MPFDRLRVDMRVGGEYLVQVVEPPVVDCGGVVHQQLLDLEAVGYFGQAQDVVD